MAEEGKVLRWTTGLGWMVFSGGHTSSSPIRAQVLGRSNAISRIAYISLADDAGDALMDDIEDLGGPTGYLVDLEYEDDATITEQIKDAGIVIVEVGSSLDALYRALQGAPAQAIKDAYQRGSVVLIEGLAVNLFGRWVISDNGELLEGLNWVEDAFIEPESSGIDDSRAVQAVMETLPEAIAINIGAGSALALGNRGLLEVWGEQKVTISLGQQYISAE